MSLLRAITASSTALRQAAVRAPAIATLTRSSWIAPAAVAAGPSATAPLLLRRCMGHKPPKHSSKITGHELTKALGTIDGWTKVRREDGQMALPMRHRAQPPQRISDSLRQPSDPLSLSSLLFRVQLLERDCIVKKYEFADFNECWAVMSRVALLAEKVQTAARSIWRRAGERLSWRRLIALPLPSFSPSLRFLPRSVCDCAGEPPPEVAQRVRPSARRTRDARRQRTQRDGATRRQNSTDATWRDDSHTVLDCATVNR